RPADYAADFVFRFVLGAVVGHFARADRMQQDRLAGLFGDLVDRQQLALVGLGAVDGGGGLYGAGAGFEAALGFAGRRLWRIHRQRRRIADEAVRIFRDDLGQSVVAEPRPFGRLIGAGEAIDSGHAEADDLGVIGK